MNNFTTNPHGVFGRHVQRDGLADGEHGEPVKTVDFDYGEVDRSLGFSEPRVDNGTGFEDAGEALSAICRWFADSRQIKSIGLKAVAMVWMLRPELLRDRTVAQLAKRFRLSRPGLQRHIRSLFVITGGRIKTPSIKGIEYRVKMSEARRRK